MIDVGIDSHIYQYDGHRLTKWSAGTFERDVLSCPHTYAQFLNSQNASGKDTHSEQQIEIGLWCSDPMPNRFFKRASGTGEPGYWEELYAVNLRDLKRDVDRRRSKQAAIRCEEDAFAYMDASDFRNGPVSSSYRKKKRYRRRQWRTVQHSGAYLKEWTRYKEDSPYGIKGKKTLCYHPIFDYGEATRTVSRSWKDQSKKRKQYL